MSSTIDPFSHPESTQIKKGFQTISGNLDIEDTDVQAYLIQYQTVTSHGHETVSDKAHPTDVAHSTGVAILTPHNWNTNKDSTKEGRVHVPIHNPPGITTSWLLEALEVNFQSEEGAAVEKTELYYDGNLQFSHSQKTSNKFHVKVTGEDIKIGYVRKRGISVALELAFPKAKSAIKLYSVTIVYKAVET